MMLEDLDDDERAVWLAAFGAAVATHGDPEQAASYAIQDFRKLRASVRLCQVALSSTRGDYYCTRREGHEGPCAAVPVLR